MTIWLIADLHLGHERLVQGWDGRPSPRSRFSSADEMNQFICDNWAQTVKRDDKVYVLGDIAWKERDLQLLAALPGRKRAVLGNHDLAPAKTYAKVFERVYGAKVIEGGYVLTHIPVHPSCLNRRSMRANIHGHLHEEVINTDLVGFNPDPSVLEYEYQPDPRYLCVSCEQVNYTPISLEAVEQRLKAFA